MNKSLTMPNLRAVELSIERMRKARIERGKIQKALAAGTFIDKSP